MYEINLGKSIWSYPPGYANFQTILGYEWQNDYDRMYNPFPISSHLEYGKYSRR